MPSDTMTPSEIELLAFHLHHSTNYLEFGSGYSTYLACTCSSIETVVSVETWEQWIVKLRAYYSEIEQAESSGKLHFQLVNIGPVKAWGYPEDQSYKHLWPEYSQAPSFDDRQYDLVLLDGRFRVACALKGILSLSEDCTLLMHDYPSRPEYGIVEDFWLQTECVDSLSAFRKKETIDKDRLRRLIHHFDDIPV